LFDFQLGIVRGNLPAADVAQQRGGAAVQPAREQRQSAAAGEATPHAGHRGWERRCDDAARLRPGAQEGARPSETHRRRRAPGKQQREWAKIIYRVNKRQNILSAISWKWFEIVMRYAALFDASLLFNRIRAHINWMEFAFERRTPFRPLGNHFAANLIKTLLKSNILPYFRDASSDWSPPWGIGISILFFAGKHFAYLLLLFCLRARLLQKTRIFDNRTLHILVDMCIRILYGKSWRGGVFLLNAITVRARCGVKFQKVILLDADDEKNCPLQLDVKKVDWKTRLMIEIEIMA
jgi:hypothetical protein